MKIQEYRLQTLKRWEENAIDAVICPPFIGPPPHQDKVFQIMYLFTSKNCPFEALQCTPILQYGCMYNLLDFPAGVCPVTRVTEDDETNSRNWTSGTDAILLCQNNNLYILK